MASEHMLELQRFAGPDSPTVFRMVAAALGEDAVVLRTVVDRAAPAATRVEVTAAPSAAVEQFRRQLAPPPLVRMDRGSRRERPLVIALVGPTGAGKTTTLAKLATNPTAFGEWRVGVLTLDTYRAGALEQLVAFADAAGLPLEVAYEAAEVPGALKRLSRCDVVLVDTPGRSPRSVELNARWSASLDALAPDEVHLVVPASLRPDLASVVRAEFAPRGLACALLTKLDEVPGDHGLADLAARLALPARWVTDGQTVPTDLHAASARVLAALGTPSVLAA